MLNPITASPAAVYAEKPGEGVATAGRNVGNAVSGPATMRLMSIDALRGFDMFWIIGAGALVSALHRMADNGPTRLLSTQLEHVDWAGFRFYDLIFPLFVFIVGVSLVFSLRRTIEEVGSTAAIGRVCRRSLLLFALALFYSGGFTNPWPEIRLLGVLNRIALCYFFAGILFCYFRPRGLALICASLLIGYWALMTYVPIRDIHLEKSHLESLSAQTGITNAAVLFNNTTERVTGKFEEGYNLANHLDFQYLPGKRWNVYWDPEGLLSTLPAIATCLLGVFAGLLLRSGAVPDRTKVTYLIAAGAAAVLAGYLWSFQFPIIKKVWSSSFVLVAGGCSAILLALFYLVVDIWKWQRWCRPFVWIGMNSITIYIVSNSLGGWQRLAQRLVGGDIRGFFERRVGQGTGDLLIAVVGLTLAIFFVRFLYQRKIFLRV